MKLSTEQARALYNAIREELNSDIKALEREIKSGNKKRISEATEKFKKTKEYEAVMTLAKAFPRSAVDWSKKESVENLAQIMFKPEIKRTYIYSSEAQTTIALLSIDCKNLKELNEKIKSHFGLKKNINIEPWLKKKQQTNLAK